jgi:putative spermidine/putrescine transport system permease protein
LLPFTLFYAVFFLLPTGAMLWLAFRSPEVAGRPAVPGQPGGLLGQAPTPAQPVVPAQHASFTWKYLNNAVHGIFFDGLKSSIEISIFTAVAAAICGTVLAWAIVSSGGGAARGGSSIFKQLVMSSSAVLANFGGLPLAFLFVCTLGTAGTLTKLSKHVGFNLADHFNLYSVHGVELVYLYFMVPLMVLVIAPALEGLRPQWQEAASNLGANRWHYWRHVAGPVLMPNVIGSIALLFCSSFSAYATAYALTNGTLPITPLQINQQLNGNVLSGPDTKHIAAALATMMIVIVIPLTLIYQLMERRTARWLSH